MQSMLIFTNLPILHVVTSSNIYKLMNIVSYVKRHNALVTLCWPNAML